VVADPARDFFRHAQLGALFGKTKTDKVSGSASFHSVLRALVAAPNILLNKDECQNPVVNLALAFSQRENA